MSTNNKKQNYDHNNIGARIEALRKQAGETQSDLAKAVGITQSTVSKLELNSIKPKAWMLSKIATHYKKATSYLVEGVGKVREDASSIIKVGQAISDLYSLHKEGALTKEQFEMMRDELIKTSVIPEDRNMD